MPTYRALSLTWSEFIGTQESVYTGKEFNSHGIGLEPQHGGRSIVLAHQYSRHDVMCKNALWTLHSYTGSRRYQFRSQGRSSRLGTRLCLSMGTTKVFDGVILFRGGARRRRFTRGSLSPVDRSRVLELSNSEKDE